MKRILLDQGLPRSAAVALREAGWDAVHTGDVGLARAEDEEILDWAAAQGRACVTLDADFHSFIAVQGRTAPSVVRVRIEGLKGDE